jgi:PAS domain S-box-containing protein
LLTSARLTLRTRFTIAMVVMVGLTAASVAWLADRTFRSIALPSALDDLGADARLLAADLRAFVGQASDDVLALRRHPSVIAAASASPRDDVRPRVAASFSAHLDVKTQYEQLRLIDGTGRELVRVDRSGAGGSISVVSADSLQLKGDREYVSSTLQLRLDAVYVSPIELNREYGAIEEPHLPVLRVATRIRTETGNHGLIVANLNMRPAFARLREAGVDGRYVYLWTHEGVYVVHPDRSRQFVRGDSLRGPARDFPQLRGVTGTDSVETRMIESPDGRLGIAALTVTLAGGPPVTLALTEPREQMLAAAAGVVRPAVVGGIVISALSILLAFVISGPLTRPMEDLVRAVREYEGSGTWSPPKTATGEVRIVSDALAATAASKRDKVVELQREAHSRRASEARFQVAVEASPNGMVMVDAKGDVILVNHETERLFGYSRNEMLGRPVEMLVPAAARGRHPDLRAGFGEDPHRRPMGAGRDLFGRRKDGSEVPIEIGLNPIETPEGIYVLASIVDISERKEAQDELRRSNAELEQFAYVASHDLQEPLRMVASYTELLERRYKGQLDDRADKYIHYAVDGAKRMQLLINDLLRYSRVNTRARPPEETDMAAAAHEIVRSVLRPAIQESGGTVEVGELPVVVADEVQMGQVLQNLIANALKFRAKDRAPKVRVYAERQPHCWRFAVEDNGIGIEAQYEDRIFQMFQRLHGVGEYPGSGVGLALVRKIIERHKGRVWFESTPASGTTFFFTIPVEAA